MKDAHSFTFTADDLADLVETVAGEYNTGCLGDLLLTIEGYVSVRGEDVLDRELQWDRRTEELAEIIRKHGRYEP